MLLALLIIAKLFQKLIPDLPNGLGDVFQILPIVIATSSLLIDKKVILISVSIYIFGIAWINPSIFINGTQWVYGASNVAGVYFLDYVIPLFLMVLPSLFKTRINIFICLLISITLGYISHVLSGWVFWGSYSWSGWGVWAYSFAANAIAYGTTLAVMILIFPIIFNSRRSFKVQDGYVNDSYKVLIDGKYYQKRIPKESVADWENERKVYQKLDIDIKFEEDGLFLKEWIKGKNVRSWNKTKINSLKKAIDNLHKKDFKGIIEHDWLKHSEYKENISSELWVKYLELIKKISKHKQVLSHNDINKLNVLWNKKEIILIDFEWSRRNSIYYDYAQFEVAEGIKLIEEWMDINEYESTKEAIIIFNYLWTFSMPNSKKIIKLRNRYKKLLP